MVRKFEFNSILLKTITEYTKYVFYDTTIYSVSTINNPKDKTLIFANILENYDVERLKQIKNSIIILNEKDLDIKIEENYLLYVKSPRKEYAKILRFILDNQNYKKINYIFENGFYIGENVEIGRNTVIEPLCMIDNNVKIGSNSIIKSGSKIRSNVLIGNNCIIKENSVIGSDGFGVERDDDGTTYKIPHLGGVKIGNNVEVGALSVIAQGSIEPTVIEDYVKIDDCSFIAHNTKIGKGTFIIANSEISGSVEIGKNCWISPNACIKDGIKVGDNSIIGLGAVVLNDVEENSVIVGNPGRCLKK
ncbi:hypothetical protein NE686_09010 [Tissierella carlieri]|uniref:UDP-3-O-[3-hydroxymyristoyl] glucosamine N-acyltransferase n=1 Tax=Tissierella carlieri TaxID=689904 RepID=A0ABT1S9T2_9FIRM|nr:UDP-3-O-(3-hydroxymyristoyl)glucosamine N-acyltransferase [Tissierella carlieri]MCQ4923221.1 hypothetical protein [Tissierella carlieri]